MNLSSVADAFGNNRSLVVVSLLLRRRDRGGSAASAFKLVQVGKTLLSYFFYQIWKGLSLGYFSHWLWWWPLSSLSFSISTTSLTGSWLISYSSWYWRKFNPPSIWYVLISRFHLSPVGGNLIYQRILYTFSDSDNEFQHGRHLVHISFADVCVDYSLSHIY